VKIPDLCDQIIEKRNGEVAAAEDGSDISLEEQFPEALEEDFLADNIEAVNDVLQNLGESTEAALIGNAEINSYLSTFQKAYDVQRRPRLRKWADIYTNKKAVASDTGALNLQMKFIGIKENEYLAKILKIGV